MEDLSLRRAEVGDQKALTALVSRCGGPSIMRRLFGSYTFPQLIETGYLSIIASPVRGEMAVDAEEEAVGFIVLSDKPRDCQEAEGWLDWFRESHAVKDVNIHNTLWVDFLLLEPRRGAEVLLQLLATALGTLPEVDQVLFQVPAEERTTDAMAAVFAEARPHLDAAFQDSPFARMYAEYRVLVCEREAFLPTLSVRQACVEDSDDLAPVFRAQAAALSAAFGEFFLADMIEAQDDQNKALVALAEDRAVGLLGVSAELDIGLLRQCFDLAPFGDFLKASDQAAMEAEAAAARDAVRAAQRVLVVGPPGSGAERAAAAAAAAHGLRLVNEGSVRDEAARKLLAAGEVLELEVFQEAVLPLLLDPPPEGEAKGEPDGAGFVLQGFPQTPDQAEALRRAGVVPDAILIVQVGAGPLARRAGRIRADPETGRLYYGEDEADEPEADEVFDRLEEREVDNEEVVLASYTAHRQLLAALLPLYVNVPAGGWEQVEVADDYMEDESKQHEGGGENGGGGVGGGGRTVYRFIREEPDTGELVGLPDAALLGEGGPVALLEGHRAAGALAALGEAAQETVRELLELRYRELSRRDDETQLTAASAAAEENTFAVTLFCLDPAREARAADFLPHLFPLFPGREFCVLTVPTTHAEGPLLRHFAAAAPRPGSTFSHALYVLHRDSVLAARNLEVVRYVKETHLAGVKRLVGGGGGGGGAALLAAQEAGREFDDVPLFENPREVSFVATVGKQVVAAVVADRNGTSTDDIAWLRANYHVEAFVVYERHRARQQAVLRHLALNPLFQAHARFVLKEVMRQYDKTVLYYEGRPGARPPPPVLQHLVPVRPRRRAQPRPGQAPPLFRREGADPAAPGGPANPLFFLSRRLLTEPKLTVNHRVCVVGGSTAALAFLEALAFTPYLNFTGLTLVAPSGLGLEYMEEEEGGGPVPSFRPVDADLPPKQRLLAMGLQSRVSVVRGRAVDLDAGARAVLLADGAVAPYDVLVLATGLQDTTAKKLGFAPGEAPPNLVTLSDARAGPRLVRHLVPALGPKDQVVVYGAGGAGPLAAVAGLLESGVPGANITLVRPGWSAEGAAAGAAGAGGRTVKTRDTAAAAARENPQGLGAPGVDDAVDAQLRELGVVMHNNLKILRAITKQNRIEALEFENMDASGGGEGKGEADGEGKGSSNGAITLDCDLLLCDDDRHVDPDIFRAVNDSGLVFDGKLVVDLRLRTVDENIYGGGTLTKYSRLHRGGLLHLRHSSQELGAYLAACVLQKIDPLSAHDEAPAEVPQFGRPRGVAARLPGGHHYARLTVPRVDPDCKKMPTGVAGESPYTLIKTDVKGQVQELIYYGKEPVEVGNLMCIVGLQESYVNSAESSYDKKLVGDWITFLRQDWASALYHDRFPQFVQTLRAQLLQEMGTQDLVDAVVGAFEEGKDPTVCANLRRMGVGTYGARLPPSTRKFIEMRALDFLRKNRGKLPRFLLPEGGTAGAAAGPK